MNKFIICTVGRTGSHIIYNYFLRHGFDGIHMHPDNKFFNQQEKNTFQTSKNLVFHYHGSSLDISDSANWTVILSSRKDLFDQYCSFLISKQTDQYTDYSEIKKFDKIKVDINDALKKSLLYYNYPKHVKKNILKQKEWKRVIEIFYEDLIINDQLLFDQIPLDTPVISKIKDFSSKSPYNFEDHIENYRSQKEEFYSIFANRPV